MAGWTNPSAAASGTGGGGGGGGGGWRFTSHSTNGRCRERGRGRPPPQAQPHYRYRPVNSNANAHPYSPPPPHQHSGRAMDHQGQGASSTSARRSQAPRLPLADDKSPAPAVVPPADACVQPDDKASRSAANFECNVCFDMAADPVVTKCGHLFCWECLYQWLHVHSHHRECPVCKGQVADDAIIPIYGRGGSAASVHTAPPRPTGARVESYRQQQQQQLEAVLDTPMDDDEDPFDLQEFRIDFGVSSLRDDMTSFMADYEVNMEQHYGAYNTVYDYDDYFGDLLGFPVLASAGTSGSGSSRGHGAGGQLMEALLSSNMDTRHHQEPAFGTSHQNRGRHDRRRQRARARAAASADHSSTDGMAMGGSSAFCHHAGAGPDNVAAGASSRPCGGWTERRGRSNRSSSSATGGGMQDGRRSRTNYN